MNNIVWGVGEVFLANRTLTEGVLSYGAPRKACTTAKIACAYTKGHTVVYESDVCVLNRPYASNAQVTIDSGTLPFPDMEELFFGAKAGEDGVYEDGSIDELAPEKALGYYFRLADGTFRCFWWFNATAQPSDENAETGDDNGPKPQTNQIVFNCVRDPIRKTRRRVKVCKTMAEVEAFFAGVLPEAAAAASNDAEDPQG